MFWHMTDPRSDDDYGQPDSSQPAPANQPAPASQPADCLLVAAMLFLISVVMPVVLLLGLLWRLLVALFARIKTGIDHHFPPGA